MILVGTVTGTAELTAHAIALACADWADEITVQRMDGLEIGAFLPPDVDQTLFLICTSTFGSGDLPDNAFALFLSLDATPRDLSRVRFGVVALGDLASHPNTFCGGADRFDEALQGLGARRLGSVCRLDASAEEAPEVAAAVWAMRWLAEFAT